MADDHIIETARLALCRPQPHHAEALLSVFGNAQAMRFIGDGTAWPCDRVGRLIDAMIAMQRERGFSLWPLRHRESGDIIGDCGLILIRQSVSLALGPEVELGYHLAPSYWGQGYATEAAQAALAYGFGQLGLDTIIAVTDPHHTASQHVLDKCGMRRVGETEAYYDKRLALFERQKLTR